MRSIARVLALSTILLTWGTALASDRVKCHITLSTGEQTIREVRVEDAKAATPWIHQQVRQSLVFLPDGVTRVGISEVYECVHPEQDFLTRESRKVAQTTPR